MLLELEQWQPAVGRRGGGEAGRPVSSLSGVLMICVLFSTCSPAGEVYYKTDKTVCSEESSGWKAETMAPAQLPCPGPHPRQARGWPGGHHPGLHLSSAHCHVPGDQRLFAWLPSDRVSQDNTAQKPLHGA